MKLIANRYKSISTQGYLACQRNPANDTIVNGYCRGPLAQSAEQLTLNQ